MKVLVAFHSKTGNTEKLAQAIHHAVANTAEKDLLPIADVAGAGHYDLVFVGFPVISHSVPLKVTRSLEGLPEGTNLALFATHGSFRGGELAVSAFFHAIGLSKGKHVLGSYGCQGQVDDKVIEALRGKPEHRGWVMEANAAVGHPDAADRQDAMEFARLMVAKARVV